MQLGTGWAVMPGVSQHVGTFSTLTHEFGHMLGVEHEVMGSNLAPGQLFSPSFAAPLLTSGRLTSRVTGPAAHVARLDDVFGRLDEQPMWADQQRLWMDRSVLLGGRESESVSVEIVAETPDRVGVMLPEIVENARYDDAMSGRAKRPSSSLVCDTELEILEEDILDELARAIRYPK